MRGKKLPKSVSKKTETKHELLKDPKILKDPILLRDFLLMDEDYKKIPLETIEMLFNKSVETQNLEVLADLLHYKPELQKKLPKTAKNPEMNLFIKRISDYNKVYNGRTKQDFNNTGISRAFYDYPAVPLKEFEKVPDIKANMQYMKKASRFQKELISFFQSNYTHVIAVQDNLKLLKKPLTELFENAPALTKPITVYRGVEIFDKVPDFAKITSITSTSYSPDVAYFFHRNNNTYDIYKKHGFDFEYLRKTACCFLKINLPKGSKFVIPTFDKTTNRHAYQQEILLPPGGTLKLIKEYYDYRKQGPYGTLERVLIKEYNYTPEINFSGKGFVIKGGHIQKNIYLEYKNLIMRFLKQELTLEQLKKEWDKKIKEKYAKRK